MKYSLRESNRHLTNMRRTNWLMTLFLLIAPVVIVIIGFLIYGTKDWVAASWVLAGCWIMAGIHHVTTQFQEDSYERQIIRARLDGEMAE